MLAIVEVEKEAYVVLYDDNMTAKKTFYGFRNRKEAEEFVEFYRKFKHIKAESKNWEELHKELKMRDKEKNEKKPITVGMDEKELEEFEKYLLRLGYTEKTAKSYVSRIRSGSKTGFKSTPDYVLEKWREFRNSGNGRSMTDENQKNQKEEGDEEETQFFRNEIRNNLQLMKGILD